MKAIMVTEFGGPQVLRYTDAAMPEINDSQVLIKVAMTSVNFADIKDGEQRETEGSFYTGN